MSKTREESELESVEKIKLGHHYDATTITVLPKAVSLSSNIRI
ncbi:MAG: hypothetical protein V1890_05450 [Candidatus Zixiibacteriota bacterium]